MFAEPSLLVSRLLFVGLVVEAIEFYRLRYAFADGGIFSRALLDILTRGTRWQVRIGATIGGSRAITFALIVQAAAAIMVIALGVGTVVGIGCALVCLLANGYLRVRRQIGGSGAEQLTFIVLVTFALVILTGGGENVRRLGDRFIAAQVILAYFASGVAKLISPVWRHGAAMTGIFATEGYGTWRLAQLMSALPWLDKGICWSVIGWELSFPVILIAPEPVMVALLGIGVLFHVSCAVMMGLNRFVWAFCGCYSAVWATAMLWR
jgi:hypothetical protein